MSHFLWIMKCNLREHLPKQVSYFETRVNVFFLKEFHDGSCQVIIHEARDLKLTKYSLSLFCRLCRIF